jgi:hypothetical protein
LKKFATGDPDNSKRKPQSVGFIGAYARKIATRELDLHTESPYARFFGDVNYLLNAWR